MKSQNTKSSDELQRDVREQVQKVNQDIYEIQSRLTPGQLIDRAIFQRRDQSIAQKFDYLKRNPVGTAFLSLGTIMLMENESRSSYESVAKDKLTTLKGKIAEQMPHKDFAPGVEPNRLDMMKSKVNDLTSKATHVKDQITSKYAQVKGELTDKIDTARANIDTAKSDVSDRFDTLRDEVSSGVDDIKTNISELRSSPSDVENWRSSADDVGIKQKVTDAYNTSKQKITSGYQMSSEKIHDLDPMTFMALGLGLGAVTGAALPVSPKEQEFVSSHFNDRLGSFDSDLRSAVNECSNILKDLVLGDVKNFSLKIL